MFAASVSAGPFGAAREPARRGRPGDLGRRIARRRRELGLSVTEVAQRAGMTPGFVDWVETRPAELGPGELARLAAALGTSRGDLLGADHDMAPPGPDAADRPTAVDLTQQERLSRLGRHGIGRVVFDAADGLTVRPVDYQVVDGAVLFRTQATGTLSEALGRRVVLEVDRFDDVLALGWSVLVTGFAEAEHRDVGHPGTGDEEPRPWSADSPDLLVRIRPIQVTGRELRFRTPAPAANEQ